MNSFLSNRTSPSIDVTIKYMARIATPSGTVTANDVMAAWPKCIVEVCDGYGIVKGYACGV